jgi:hypothetical protein
MSDTDATATPVPVRSPQDLTDAWLTARLAAAGRLPEGGAVSRFSTTAIGTGQMSESFRIALQYADGGPAGPRSVVLKVAATDEGSRATGAGMGAYAREIRFYQQLAPTLEGPLADCLHAEIDEPSGWFTLLLEDLAPARQGDQIAGCTLEEAAGAVDALASLQASRWDEDELTRTDWLTQVSPLNQGLLTYLLPGFEERYAGRVGEEHLEVVRRFVASADAWSAETPRPHALVHADFRLDNMLFGARGDGRPVVVDWQTLTYGPALLDLSYFLGGSLSVEDRRAGEEALVRRYHEALLAGGVTNLDWDTCWREYRRQVFHGIVMAVGASMLVQRTDRGDDMFMAVIARHCQQAIDLDSVALLPDADAVGGTLEPLRPDPADEGHHEPDADPLWNESWYMDFTTTADGIAGYTRIGLYPNRDEAWITLSLVRAGTPTAMLVDLHVPLPQPGSLAVTGGDTDLVADHVCTQPLSTFTVTCTGTGELHEDPAAVLRGEAGTPVPVAMDLEWETDGEPYAYRMLTRYEIPCRVRGTVRVGEDTFTVDGKGQRDHSWGARDWWAADWCWNAGALDDGTRFHSVEARLPSLPRMGMGYVQGAEGTPMTDLRTVAIDEQVAPDGLVSSARLQLSPPDLDLRIQALAHGPLLLVADDGRVSHFPRSLFQVDAGDGRTGLAWVEFNRNQPKG